MQNTKIKLAICGYGNLGKALEAIINNSDNFSLVKIFSKRELAGGKFCSYSKILEYKDKIDCMLIAGGSAKDLPEQTPFLAEHFCVIDSFDTHDKIPQHLERVNLASEKGKKTAIISVGWDPGIFSLMRLYFVSILPKGTTHTFWGEGVSQGHSDAIRRVEGVENAVQYTVPDVDIINDIKEGKAVTKTAKERHKRVCFVVAKENADIKKIENDIVSMPDYFKGYKTTVNFISKEELEKNHSTLPHGGTVLHNGLTAPNASHSLEFSIKLQSNPEFTASVMLSFANAAVRLNKEKKYGAKTVFDVEPKYLFREGYSEALKLL